MINHFKENTGQLNSSSKIAVTKSDPVLSEIADRIIYDLRDLKTTKYEPDTILVP